MDPSDFWRRWHISLSTCLRDYLYIPLGGSRGTSLQTYRNLMITMLLGGIWHGANWTFLFWGFYHGLLLAAYRPWAGTWDRLPRAARNVVTMLLVIVGWVFFRSESFAMALTLLEAMFMPWRQYGPLSTLPWASSLMVVLVTAAAVAHGLPNTFELEHRWGPLASIGMAALLLLCLAVIYGANSSPFLYFQF